MRILIYGMGVFGRWYYREINKRLFGGGVLGYLETHALMESNEGVRVYSLDDLSQINFDEIHIANARIETLFNLFDLGIEKERIVLANLILVSKYVAYNAGILDMKINLLESVITGQSLYLLEQKEHMELPMADIDIAGNRVAIFYNYALQATMAMLRNAIYEQNINGDVAVLGVYRGESARYVQKLFKDKIIHLFDTFEGAPEFLMKEDYEKGRISASFLSDMTYRDTSLEYVREHMEHPEMCKFHKGIFPSTVPKESIEYSFVEITVSLYQPTLDGLRYFYPRLSKGGYIVIYSCNETLSWRGVKEAVSDFMKEYGYVPNVPIADEGGALILTK